MGLTPGTRIKVIKVAPMDGPVEVSVRGSKLALGQDIACNVFVEVEPANCRRRIICHVILISNSKGKASNGKNGKRLTFALAGNANVGKSVIFNQLTGSNQIIGNWPGKTVDRAEGTLSFEGHEIKIIDLPGIYSFSTFSMEELVSRDYVALEKPDVVINVVDASVLERNLFFTLQLLEMQAPLVLCLNQVDVAKSKGMIIDKEKLEQALGVPVVFATATRGEGIYELVRRSRQSCHSQTKT